MASSVKVVKQLAKFPCALCGNVDQTRLAAICYLRIAHSLNAKDDSQDDLYVPDLFVPHEDALNIEESSSHFTRTGQAEAGSPGRCQAETGSSGAKQAEAGPSGRRQTEAGPSGVKQAGLAASNSYLPSTMREKKLGKKAKLREHCQLCGQLQLSNFNLRMHLLNAHNVSNTEAKEPSVNPVN